MVVNTGTLVGHCTQYACNVNLRTLHNQPGLVMTYASGTVLMQSVQIVQYHSNFRVARSESSQRWKTIFWQGWADSLFRIAALVLFDQTEATFLAK